MEKKRVEGKRYRATSGLTGTSSARSKQQSETDTQRARYRKAENSLNARKKQMTYDDYLELTKDTEAIIDVNDDSRLDTAREVSTELLSRVKRYSSAAMVTVSSKLKANLGFKHVAKWFEAHKKLSLLLTSLLILVLSGYFLISRNTSSSETESNAELANGEVQSVTDSQSGQLDFIPVTPDDPSGVSPELRYDPSVGVASFIDLIQGNTVTVSQQPLSDAQKIDPATSLETIAVSLLTSIELQTDKGSLYLTAPTADAEDPSQTGIFVINDLLVFIRTRGVTINNDAWVRYVDSL